MLDKFVNWLTDGPPGKPPSELTQIRFAVSPNPVIISKDIYFTCYEEVPAPSDDYFKARRAAQWNDFAEGYAEWQKRADYRDNYLYGFIDQLNPEIGDI